MFKISKKVRRLSNEEKDQYKKDGYLTGLPVFSSEANDDLSNFFVSLSEKVDKKIDINQTAQWHKASHKFYKLCTTPEILDYVEDLLGPNFFLWGGQFFLKEPKDGSVVPWHQDAQYWPLFPANAVTVWLALYDTNEENGAMRVVKGSHIQGEFKHHTNKAQNLVLDKEVSNDQIKQDDIISLNLKAGEISLHNDALLHGSEPNISNYRRCGLTMRFSPVNVKADLSIWPHFEGQLVRGIDNYKLNPIAPIPRGEAVPTSKFQHSSEFEISW
tara:strand:- start:10018 stop:10833 length:816 start_codon:yes stop_codon:yes gene_type:complete